MDPVLVLDLVGDILAVSEGCTELLVASPETTQESSDFRQPILEKLDTSRKDVIRILESPTSEFPDGAASAKADDLALREAATACLEYSKSFSEGADNSSQTRSRQIAYLPDVKEKLERLSQDVTRHAHSILRKRVSELSKVVDSLRSGVRYNKPEHESRIDSMSHDLDELKRGIQEQPVNARATAPAVFTEAQVRLLRVRLASLTEAEDDMFSDKIVASLNYDSRPVRHDSVPQAHKDTFQWAFDSRLSEWLRSGGGAFWISGKPGSGKSTFMKFISRHPQAKELLAEWAGSADILAVASHFFWIAGTPIQKSWQGLFQSLLFDVCHNHPSVVPLVSPNRWAAAKNGQWQTAAEPWSVSELSAALRRLAWTDKVPLKMCFFIDGLDEYDSDHAELCNVLSDMASSPRIKMCLSSRPWPIFEKSFGGDNKERLDIHLLTRDDIQGFVRDQLETHSSWLKGESKHEHKEQDKLVQQIVEKADGVFLWAFLVTRSLREGLSSGDTIPGLQRRLVGLPTDLEQLFKHMLESVDPANHPKMAGILQVSAHALEPLSIDLYWQVEQAFTEPDYAFHCPIGAAPFEVVSEQRAQASRSINEKTKGLLKQVNQHVEFLHRTVKDFVMTRDMAEYLRSKLPANYNGFISIATAYLGFMKTRRQDHSLVAGIVRQGRGLNSGPFISHLNQALMYAAEAFKSDDAASRLQTTQLLDVYEAAVDQMVRSGHVTIRGLDTQGCNPKLPFREELLRHDLTPYVATKLRDHPDFFDIFDDAPLYAALTPMSLSSGESPAPVIGILELILERGGDPNILPQSRGPSDPEAPSPWVVFARGTMSVFNMLSGPCMFPALRWNDSLNGGIFDLLLAHGADPNRPLVDRINPHTVFSHFLDIALSVFLGEECFDGYVRTLDAFLRAGASLGVPKATVTSPDAEVAKGNLGRPRPDEPLVKSYCTVLKGLMARLSADPKRAQFVSSVTEKLILHCHGREEELQEFALAIAEGCPEQQAKPLLVLVDGERELAKKQGEARKRQRGSWGGASPPSGKHFRSG
ncbi:hypothetical protein GQ53DRAFT_849393 [Thozetella sp. PMI_491]|nr:hypothetical protein GQ53DRAFT_849393 [Thozetella sp. PMI_491]